MKTKRSIIILLCAVILLGGIYLFISHDTADEKQTETKTNETAGEIKRNDPVFETEVENILSVKIENEDSFEIHKKDDKWCIKDSENLLFNSSQLYSTVLDYTKVVPMLTVAETASDKSSYGLDKPSASATVTLKDGEEKTFFVGSSTKGGNGYYFMISGDEKVYTVSNVLAENMKKTRDSYRDTVLFNVSTEDITEINMNVYGVGDVSVKRLEEQSDIMTSWLMTKPFELGVYDEKFNEYVLSPISSVTISGYVSDNPTDEQLEKSGLVNPENYYEVKTADASYKVLIGNNYDGNYVVKRDDLPSVYLVSADNFSFLITDVFEYLNSYSYLPARTDISEIDVSASGKEYKLRQDRYDGKKSGTFYINDVEASNEVFAEAYKGIVGIKIDGKVKDTPKSDAVPELSYTVKLNDGTEETVDYVRMNGMYMYQFVNGKCEFYVKSADVEAVEEALDTALSAAENPKPDEKAVKAEKEKKEKKTTNALAYVIVAAIICLIAVFPISMLVGSKKKK